MILLYTKKSFEISLSILAVHIAKYVPHYEPIRLPLYTMDQFIHIIKLHTFLLKVGLLITPPPPHQEFLKTFCEGVQILSMDHFTHMICQCRYNKV